MESNSDKLRQSNEHYSVDEMMGRLKQSDQHKRSVDPSKDGELITRPDGSQVIKVRKHKRRSKQPPKKKNETNPRIKWAVIGSMIGLFVILIAGIVFILAKYNGRSFKEKTESIISALNGAQSTELTKLRVSPLSAKASKAELSWGNDSFCHSVSISDIEADIKATSFLSLDWIGEEVVASQGNIQLQIPLKNAAPSDPPPTSPYLFETFRCEKFDVHFGTEHDAPAIAGLQVSLRKHVDGRYQIVFNNGLMKIPNWPTLGISSGIMTLNSDDADIEARLAASNNLKGELLINGRISKDTTRPMSLDVLAKNYPIQELLGQDLGRIIQGQISGDMGTLSYDYKKKNSEALSFIMPFNSTELHISELPMLNDLKDLTGDTQYVHPTLNHCRGTIIRTLNGVTLNDLNLIGSRLITLKGSISVTTDGTLSGELDVGIPARFFGKKHPAPAIFSKPHNGTIYTKVTLGGTIYNPHDNLNSLLRASKNNSLTTPSTHGKTGVLTPLSPAQEAQKDARQKEQEFEDLTR